MYPRPLSLLLFLCTCLFACGGEGTSDEAHTYSNQLAGESSPYLLLHAHNPVDWHPWNEKALDKAGSEDKMLLISVGYSSCHWCHVMERESFSDTAVAALMNRHFVSIKVDREERPDIDEVYMSACQLASDNSCGWPLNVVAMPDGRPVWAGTYFPKKAWLDVLRYFVQLSQNEPAKLEDFADRLARGLALESMPSPSGDADGLRNSALADSLASSLLQTVDYEQGGRTGAPKFPMPSIWNFLLELHQLTGDPTALEAVTATLDNMARGGLYDRLGGGFSRYATDLEWRVPHFEKMLYDNAQLISLYARAYQQSQNPAYRRIAEQTLAFVSRELSDGEGGFYASLDAESEGEEGKFYTWTKNEVESILAAEGQRDLVIDLYDISQEGNWEDGKNILRLASSIEQLAREHGMSVEEAEAGLAQAESLLLDHRNERVRPRRDDKRICAWNALMLIALTDAYNAFGDRKYLDAALRNADFLKSEMLRNDGSLLRSFPSGKNEVSGFLEDYALTANAFLSLYQASFEEKWLVRAVSLIHYANSHFFNGEQSLYFATSDQDASLVIRPIPVEDNVIPSGNAVMARTLYRIGKITHDTAFLHRSEAMLERLAGNLASTRDAAFSSYWARTLLDREYPPFEVAVVGADFEAQRAALMKHFLPQAVFLGGENEGSLSLLENKLIPGKTMIYVCRDRVCKLPVSDVEDALAQLRAW